MNPLKTIVIEGKFKDLHLRQKLCYNYCNLNSGIWEIAIADISFHCDTHLIEKIICSLSCNLVIGTQFSPKGILTTENIKLLNFQIDVNDLCGITYVPLRWFTVNNNSEYLSIFIKRWPNLTNILISDSLILSVTILMKKRN